MYPTKAILILLLTLPILDLQGQDSTRVAYSFNYRFTDGIYLGFNQFRNNQPLPPESVVFENSGGKYSDVYDFIGNTKEISYYNANGNLSTIAVNKIWGYCRNGKPHINYINDFRQIPFIGSLCHFVATITVYYDNNPNLYYDPYYYNATPNRYYSTEAVQVLIDMQTGDILDFNEENLAVLLQRDDSLGKEYSELSKKKKRKMLFYYLRLFNEKNPLYMPVNQ